MNIFKTAFCSINKFIKNISLLWSNSKVVEQYFRIPRWYTLLNWFFLRVTFTNLSLNDYFGMHLFNPELNFNQKKDFLGFDIWRKIIIKYFPAAGSEDKLFYYDIVRQHGYKSPFIYGLFHSHRRLSYSPTIKNKEELKNFLQFKLSYPCFTKPVVCSGSYDTFYLTGYDNLKNILFDQEQGPIAFEEFYSAIEQYYLGSGYIFQNVLQGDPLLNPISNQRLCTMRILFIITDHGPECLGALLKIPMYDNHADNFWRLGNVMAILDQETGRVTKALQKTELDFPIPIREHPVTKKIFTDFVIPEWSNLKKEISELSCIFYKYPWQSWDIAFTNDGWMPLELNFPGEIHFAQWLYTKGLKSRLEKFLNIKIQ